MIALNAAFLYRICRKQGLERVSIANTFRPTQMLAPGNSLLIFFLYRNKQQRASEWPLTCRTNTQVQYDHSNYETTTHIISYTVTAE